MASQKPSKIVKLKLPLRLPQRPGSSNTPTTSSSAGASSNATPSTQKGICSGPRDILDHVTQSQLVLALTIQKSKPQGLSTKEYCELLQKHIKLGPKAQTDLRHIDTCEFWKDQCTKIHLEKRQLESKLLLAEESNRVLRLAIQQGGTEVGVELDASTQRGSLTTRIDPPARANSRKRPSPEPEDGVLERLDNTASIPTDAGDGILRLSSYVRQVKRQRGQLEETCKGSDTLDQINGLTKQMLHMLALLDTSFFDNCMPFYLLKTSTKDKHTLDLLQRVMRHVGVSIFACFKAFDELCNTIPGRSKKSELVYQLVLFFRKSLDFLRTLSNLQAETEEDEMRQMRRNKKARLEEGEYAVNKYLAGMLASVSYGVEWKAAHPGHADLLEGILFTVLEHTGRLLSEAVFDEHVATSNNPGNITTESISARKSSARIEARYIVQVLHAALGGNERKDLVAQVLAAGKINAGSLRQGSLHGVFSADLLVKAKKLLQSTLMKSAIGGEDLETLRLPTPPVERTVLPVAKGAGVERYGSDWLVETVWTLIGWDLMN